MKPFITFDQFISQCECIELSHRGLGYGDLDLYYYKLNETKSYEPRLRISWTKRTEGKPDFGLAWGAGDYKNYPKVGEEEVKDMPLGLLEAVLREFVSRMSKTDLARISNKLVLLEEFPSELYDPDSNPPMVCGRVIGCRKTVNLLKLYSEIKKLRIKKLRRSACK